MGSSRDSEGPLFPFKTTSTTWQPKPTPYVGARGLTKGKFGQTTSPAVAAFVIKLIVPRHMWRSTYKRLLVADGKMRKVNCCGTCGVRATRIPEAKYILRPLCNHLAILDLIHLTDANSPQAQNPGSQSQSSCSFEEWRLKSIP